MTRPCPQAPPACPLGSASVPRGVAAILLAARILLLPSDSSLPPVPRRGPVASMVRMSQVYGLEVLPGGCSLSCNRLWGGEVSGDGTQLAAATLACH